MAIAPDLIPASRQLNLLWERAQALLTRRWLPTVVNLGALLILITVIVSWAWSVFKPPAPKAAVAVTTSRAETLNLQPLLDAHLFGRASRGPGGSMEAIPISSLNLVVMGVIAAAGSGYAMISVDGRPQESYAVGQEIVGGAVLQSVLSDRVLIQRGGVTESLLLQELVKPLEGLSAYVPPVSQAPAIQQQGEKQFQVTREEVNKQMRSPDFLSQARLIPSPDGGFLVREIKPGSVYEKLGLRMGDVIRGVNGTPVNNAEDAMKFYQQLTQLSNVRLEIVRAGQIEQLQYNLQ